MTFVRSFWPMSYLWTTNWMISAEKLSSKENCGIAAYFADVIDYEHPRPHSPARKDLISIVPIRQDHWGKKRFGDACFFINSSWCVHRRGNYSTESHSGPLKFLLMSFYLSRKFSIVVYIPLQGNKQHALNHLDQAIISYKTYIPKNCLLFLVTLTRRMIKKTCDES